jgi:hypothetical protein
LRTLPACWIDPCCFPILKNEKLSFSFSLQILKSFINFQWKNLFCDKNIKIL